ncbi:MAG: SPASM domain-containing protein [Candidatus Diapherotrites archaeon]|nr:SPASM domain-containing protein [Candidatus Diapherotrites archaeon]
MGEIDFVKRGFVSKEQFEFPSIINVCVLRGSCPCECIHCPVGLTPKEKRGDFFGNETINIELFKKIVDEIKNYSSSVLRIHAVGEPLLWNRLEEALKYSKLRKVKTWIFTSAATKNNLLLEILAKNCSIIEVSINSFDSENYKNTKGIDEFNLIKKNLKFLSDYKNKNRFHCKILVSRVQSKDKEYDESFVEYWKKSGLVNDAFVRSYHDYNHAISNKFDTQIRENVPCLVHWARFNVDCSGEVVICFNELFKGKKVKPEFIIGDLNKDSIKEIWQGKRLEQIREAQLVSDYGRLSLGCKLPCESCTCCQPLNTTRTTSENQIKDLNSCEEK